MQWGESNFYQLQGSRGGGSKKPLPVLMSSVDLQGRKSASQPHPHSHPHQRAQCKLDGTVWVPPPRQSGSPRVSVVRGGVSLSLTPFGVSHTEGTSLQPKGSVSSHWSLELSCPGRRSLCVSNIYLTFLCL